MNMDSKHIDEKDGESGQSLLRHTSDDEDSHVGETRTPRRSSRLMLWLTLFNLVLFVFSAGMLLRSTKDTYLVKLRSAFSPMYRTTYIESHIVEMNGTVFTPDDPPDICRLEPGPSTDKLWEDILFDRFVPLTASELRAMGKDPSKYAKLEPYDHPTRGVPADTENDPRYFAQMDVFHKLHCLNELRKGTFEQYWGPRYTERDRRYWQHKAHCVSMLFQDLKCNANGDLVPAYWLRLGDGLMHDFSIQRKCANWDAIVAWRDEYALSWQEYSREDAPLIVKPKDGDPALNENPEGYYRLWGPDGLSKDLNVWNVSISDEEVAKRILGPL